MDTTHSISDEWRKREEFESKTKSSTKDYRVSIGLESRRDDKGRGVIFDMDGTLISTEAVIVHCVNETSKKYLKRTLPQGDAFWTLGPPARNIIKGFTSGLPGKPVKEAVEDYLACYRNNFPDKTILFRGIPRLLQKLRTSGRRLAVVTAEERSLMEFNLATLGLKDYFDTLVSRDDVLRPKPDPESIRLAMRAMKTN